MIEGVGSVGGGGAGVFLVLMVVVGRWLPVAFLLRVAGIFEIPVVNN